MKINLSVYPTQNQSNNITSKISEKSPGLRSPQKINPKLNLTFQSIPESNQNFSNFSLDSFLIP
jgi:hypothetical protein